MIFVCYSDQIQNVNILYHILEKKYEKIILYEIYIYTST